MTCFSHYPLLFLAITILFVMPLHCLPSCPKNFETSRKASLTHHQSHCPAYLAQQNAAILLRATRSNDRKQQLLMRKQGRAAWQRGVTCGMAARSSLQQSVGPPMALDMDPLEAAGISLDSTATDPLPPISLTPPDLPASVSAPPIMTQSGRPARDCHLPKRYHRDPLPEPPRPAVEPTIEPEVRGLHSLPRVHLIVRDTLKTIQNSFGIWREYLHRPSYDPDAFVSTTDLAVSHSSATCVDSPDLLPDRGYRNKSVALLMNWQNDGETMKSNGSVNKLVQNVLLHPDFQLSDLPGFNVRRENEIADKADAKSTLLSLFSEANVEIEVPSGDKNVPSAKFTVPGLHYRSLLSVLRAAFADPLAEKFHLSPYKMFHKSSTSEEYQRVYSEVYDSDVFIDKHDQVQRAPMPPDDLNCRREKVVAALMFWSDSTQLANFGTAKLWPIYMMLGNLSKYIRALPSSGACMHVAYIPQLPDSFEDFASDLMDLGSEKEDDVSGGSDGYATPC